jgi:hypothetical protein
MAKSVTRTIKIKSIKRPGPNKKGNAENLKQFQFQPGKSGNPSGRPKGSGTKKISEAYTAYLEQKMPDDECRQLNFEPGTTWADALAIQTMRRSLGLVDANGICFTAITELRETTEGKTPDKAELTGKDGKPLAAAAPPVFNIRFKESEQ